MHTVVAACLPVGSHGRGAGKADRWLEALILSAFFVFGFSIVSSLLGLFTTGVFRLPMFEPPSVHTERPGYIIADRAAEAAWLVIQQTSVWMTIQLAKGEGMMPLSKVHSGSARQASLWQLRMRTLVGMLAGWLACYLAGWLIRCLPGSLPA